MEDKLPTPETLERPPQKERITIGDDSGDMSRKIQQEELVDQETDLKKSEYQVSPQLKPPCNTEVTVEGMNNDSPLSLRKRPLEDVSTESQSKQSPYEEESELDYTGSGDDNSLPTEYLTPLPHKSEKGDLEESPPILPQEDKVQERPFPTSRGDNAAGRRVVAAVDLSQHVL